MSSLNSSVQLLVSANVQSSTKKLFYFWDSICLIAKIVLLNQTQVSALSYNVTHQVKLNATNLDWISLPSNVQTFLLTQSPKMLLKSTFSQWAWTNSSSPFANETFYSLLMPDVQNCILSASNLLAPIKFNMKIDLSVLNKTLATLKKNDEKNLLVKFFQNFYQHFTQYLPKESENRETSAVSIYNDATHRAFNLVRHLTLLKSCIGIHISYGGAEICIGYQQP